METKKKKEPPDPQNTSRMTYAREAWSPPLPLRPFHHSPEFCISAILVPSIWMCDGRELKTNAKERSCERLLGRQKKSRGDCLVKALLALVGGDSLKRDLHDNLIRVDLSPGVHASDFRVVPSDLQPREGSPVLQQPALECHDLIVGKGGGLHDEA